MEDLYSFTFHWAEKSNLEIWHHRNVMSVQNSVVRKKGGNWKSTWRMTVISIVMVSEACCSVFVNSSRDRNHIKTRHLILHAVHISVNSNMVFCIIATVQKKHWKSSFSLYTCAKSFIQVQKQLCSETWSFVKASQRKYCCRTPYSITSLS